MRNPLLFGLVSATLASAGWASGAAAAPTQPAGSYQASCRNILIASDGQLTAECKDMRGAFRWSRIVYQRCHGELGNNNGVLTCNGATATVAPVGGSSPVQPTGSYQASCRNIQVAGGALSAECKDMRGAFRGSSIPYQRCHGELGNNNGVLTCNGATATVAPAPGGDDSRWGGGSNGPQSPNPGWNGGDRPSYGDRGYGDPGYGQGGPDNGGPGYGQGGPVNNGSDASQGVYPEFAPLEDHIRDSIRDGLRNDMIERDDAHDLFGQLRDIQARERWEYQAHGWNLPQEDRWRLRHDLRQLDSLVEETRQQP